MNTVATESLLDEADFLAELETLEHDMTPKRRRDHAVAELPVPARSHAMGKFVEPPPVAADAAAEDGRPSLASQFAAAAMFVLMMGVGAAGAALVFHDRFARILAFWTS